MPNDRAPLPPASPLPSGAVAGASVGKQTLVASAPSGAPRADGDVDRDAYYRHHAPEIVRDAAAHLSGLPFGLHDPALRWQPAGDRRFAAAMAAQLPPVAPATAEIESLVRPELLGRLIDDARVRTREPNTGIAGEVGPDAYAPAVGVAVGNALARRTAEALDRIAPRYAQATLDASGRAPSVDEVAVSHPIDPRVVRALASGQLLAIDGARMSGAAPRRPSRHVVLEHAGGGGYWYRLLSPLDATPEEVAHALTGSATEAFRLEVAHPLYGLKGDSRGRALATSSDYQNPAGVLIAGGGALVDEAALAQAGAATKSARSAPRILEQMRRNATLLRTSVHDAAQRFGLGRRLDDAAHAIEVRAARLATAGEAEVAKWDLHVQRQQDAIARGARGLEFDAMRLAAFSAQYGGGREPGGLALPDAHRQVLRADAERWTRAIAMSDLPASAERALDDASQRSATVEIEILELGLAAPQAAVLAASGQPVTAAALDVPGLAARAAHARTQLGIARAQLQADPSKLDPAALQAASVETRDLAFESQVAAQAAALDDAWRALNDADTWMSSAIDHLETAAMQREGAGYRARWLAIHAQIRKGREGDKAAMSAARTAFETLCGEPAFVAYLGRAQRLLVRLHKAHVIASLIVVVAITIASMGAGAGISGLLGGAAADGAAGLGVARGLASAAGLFAEALTFSALSNAAFSRDHSVGAIAIELGKNLLMFGAMRGVAAGFRMAGLAKLVEAGARDGASLAQAMKAGGAVVGQAIVNGGVGVLMAVVEAKVKERLGGKPMTEAERDQLIGSTVAQTILMTIGARLLQSPLQKLTIKAAYTGARWRAAVEGWTRDRQALASLPAPPSSEQVIEAAMRDRAQIACEVAALEELRAAAERDPHALDGSGLAGGGDAQAIDGQLATLRKHGEQALGMVLALSTKELAPQHYEVPRAQVGAMLDAQRAHGSQIVVEATDPRTTARTWRIAPHDGAALRVTETVPDWVLTSNGQRVVEAARRAGLDDAALCALSAPERARLLAVDQSLASSSLEPSLVHALETALVAAGRHPRAVEAVAHASAAQRAQLAALAALSPHATGKLLSAVGLDVLHHRVARGPGEQVRLNDELDIHPSRLAEIDDAHLRTILDATAKSPNDTQALLAFTRSGSYRLRFRYQLRQNEDWLVDLFERIGRRNDPAAQHILDTLDDAGRTRLQEARGGDSPKGTDPELRHRAANYALDRHPANAREFVDTFEMFTSEYKRMRDQFRDEIDIRKKASMAAGAAPAVAEREASQAVLGREVQGFSAPFNRAVLELLTPERVAQRRETLGRELDGRVGAREIASAEPASIIAEIRATSLQLGTESSSTYHANKHDLPAEHSTLAYGPNEMSRYLKSANETIHHGDVRIARTQDGGYSIVFKRGYAKRSMEAIVRVNTQRQAVIATYGDAK